MSGSEQGLKGILALKKINSFLFVALPFLISCAAAISIRSQTINGQPPPAPAPTPHAIREASTRQSSFSPGANFSPSNNYLKNSAAFRQEIMRMEIRVVRGQRSVPITLLPRVQKDDLIKMRLLEEAVGGIKPDQSVWDWTFLLAFVNPNRRMEAGNRKESAVSEEIQFRKSGWYKEYSFVVPYDSQPVFFLYPKPKYREKILKLISRNYNEVRKLGEKTIEIAGAYAQIGLFLNELQAVLHQTQYSRYRYASSFNYYNPSNYYNPYNPNRNNQLPDQPFNYNAFVEQSIERLAKSFNIQMPNCWQSGGASSSPYGSYNYYGGSYNNQNNFGYAISQDLLARAQCVAKTVRLEDFDFSLSQLLKQGGILVAAQLRDKYPPLAYWINLAAAAIDFILKVFRKTPLKIMPTIIQASDNSYGNHQAGLSGQGGYMQNSGAYAQGSSRPPATSGESQSFPQAKISLYAESQPDANEFVTVYPIVAHKWQAEPDPEVISLDAPVLAEPCLHPGTNLLKNTALGEAPEADAFSRDFKLVISSPAGYKREFPLKKNFGLGGWELNLTKEDLNSFSKAKTQLEAVVTGARGFNEIKSPPFNLPLFMGGNFLLTEDSKRGFVIGGKRTIKIRNPSGNCRCVQAVVYRPSFGGQFVFEAASKDRNNQLQFSADGREVSFEIDATFFQPAEGQLEIRTFGGETANLNIKLYPPAPHITDFKISKNDRYAIITGERLEQLQYVKINGKRAVIAGNNSDSIGNFNNQYSNQKGAISGNQYQAANQSSNQFQNLNLNQRAVIFENPNDRQTAPAVSLELGLEDERAFAYPQQFIARQARPTIAANEAGEIEGVFFSGAKDKTNRAGISTSAARVSQLNLSRYPVVSTDASQLSIVVQNKLTDYEFRGENLQIETRFEKSQALSAHSPNVAFEVLDGNTLRLNFSFDEQSQKFIGGRRLQFRIRDRERGDSDWYIIKQTFVRTPRIKAVKCAPEMNDMCQIIGDGIDYIQQVSVDGGNAWHPIEFFGASAQSANAGQKMAMIPPLVNKNLLQIKLRDFPRTQGLTVTDFSFINSVKNGRRKANQKR